MKRSLVALLLLLASVGYAQESTVLRLRYDVASTTYVYGSYLGQNGNPFGGPIQGQGRVKTTGSSTTVVEETVDALPFTPVSVGDILTVRVPATGAQTSVVVTAKASGASITVDTAVDLTAGSSFTYLRTSVGADLGWVGVSGDDEKTWSWTIATINATSIEVQIQCMDSYLGAPIITVYPPVTSQTDTCFTGAFTAAKTCKFVATEPYAQCRWGLKVTGDAGAQSVTAGYMGRKAAQ